MTSPPCGFVRMRLMSPGMYCELIHVYETYLIQSKNGVNFASELTQPLHRRKGTSWMILPQRIQRSFRVERNTSRWKLWLPTSQIELLKLLVVELVFLSVQQVFDCALFVNGLNGLYSLSLLRLCAHFTMTIPRRIIVGCENVYKLPSWCQFLVSSWGSQNVMSFTYFRILTTRRHSNIYRVTKVFSAHIMMTSKWEFCLVQYEVSTCLALRRKSHLQVNKIYVPVTLYISSTSVFVRQGSQGSSSPPDLT